MIKRAVVLFVLSLMLTVYSTSAQSEYVKPGNRGLGAGRFTVTENDYDFVAWQVGASIVSDIDIWYSEVSPDGAGSGTPEVWSVGLSAITTRQKRPKPPFSVALGFSYTKYPDGGSETSAYTGSIVLFSDLVPEPRFSIQPSFTLSATVIDYHSPSAGENPNVTVGVGIDIVPKIFPSLYPVLSLGAGLNDDASDSVIGVSLIAELPSRR